MAMEDNENSRTEIDDRPHTPFLFRSIRNDLRSRIRWYGHDWKQGLHPKIIATVLFMYFTSIIPAITFGNFLTEKTQGEIGTVEVLLSTALTGSTFAIFGGQPLVILGVTGPVSIFTFTMYELSLSLGIPFLQWFAWTNIWSGIMHMILAALNACNLVNEVTRYSCEIFGFLIAVIYVDNAITEIVAWFYGPLSYLYLEAAFLSLLICIGTFYLAITFYHARTWSILVKPLRAIVADYGVTFSVILFSVVPLIPPLNRVEIPMLTVPDGFQTTSDRPWLVPGLGTVDVGVIFSALLPAIVLTVLFYFDHNVSSLLSQKKEYNLKKGSAYNWDFFVVGLNLVVCGILGIPPTNGLIPQAPLHVRSLAVIEQEEVDGGKFSREVWISVFENRLSNLLQSLLIGFTLAFIYILAFIPNAVLAGLFIYMGFSSFYGNQFAQRLLLVITDPKQRPPYEYMKHVPYPKIIGFTAIQLIFAAGIYAVTKTPAAISFPVFILLLVPFRKWLLPRIFRLQYVQALDSA